MKPGQSTKVVVISDATRMDSRFEVIRIKDGKVQDPDKNKSSISAAEQFERKSKKMKKEDAAVKMMPSSSTKKGISFKNKIVSFKNSNNQSKIQKESPREKIREKTYPKNSKAKSKLQKI